MDDVYVWLCIFQCASMGVCTRHGASFQLTMAPAPPAFLMFFFLNSFPKLSLHLILDNPLTVCLQGHWLPSALSRLLLILGEFFNLSKISIYLVHVHPAAHMCKAEDNLQASVRSFYCVVPRDQIQIISLWSKYLLPPELSCQPQIFHRWYCSYSPYFIFHSFSQFAKILHMLSHMFSTFFTRTFSMLVSYCKIQVWRIFVGD